jgi:hypothetical protein
MSFSRRRSWQKPEITARNGIVGLPFRRFYLTQLSSPIVVAPRRRMLHRFVILRFRDRSRSASWRPRLDSRKDLAAAACPASVKSRNTHTSLGLDVHPL